MCRHFYGWLCLLFYTQPFHHSVGIISAAFGIYDYISFAFRPASFQPVPARLGPANVAIWMLKYKYAYKSGQTIKAGGGHDSQWGASAGQVGAPRRHIRQSYVAEHCDSWDSWLDNAKRCRISMSVKSHENVAKMNRSICRKPKAENQQKKKRK